MNYNFKAPGIYTMEVFCQNPGCPAREAQLTIKLYNAQEIAKFYKTLLRCVICLQPVSVHWVHDREQQHTLDCQDSIGMVNAELYAREEREKGAELVAIPVNVLLVDDLPATWKAIR